MNSVYKTFRFFIIITLIFTTYGCGRESSKAETEKQNIQFENLRVILPPPVAGSTSVYGSIKNTGGSADTLLSIRSNAGMVMLHQSVIEGGQARMKHIETYEISPNKALELKPMSYHIMLMNINHDIIKENGTVLMGFTFEKAGKIEREVAVLTK